MNRILLIVLVMATQLFACSQSKEESKSIATNTEKMKVEIWSDVMCPFCYIGKRKFEMALEKFAHKDQIEVVWRSFQLNPNLKTDTSKSINEYLAEEKGWTKEYTQQMSDYVEKMAKDVGLDYHLENAVIANSMDAHRLSHLAKKYNKQNDLEELLFKAYFEQGRNTADRDFLTELGLGLSIPKSEITEMFASDLYKEEVAIDIYESQQIGVKGVPFFAFNDKYAVSGAQDPKAFLETLEKAYAEWGEKNTQLIMDQEGKVCTPNGECK